MREKNGLFEKIDQKDFIEKTRQCYQRYGVPPIKYRDKSGVVLDANDIIELAFRLGLIQKH